MTTQDEALPSQEAAPLAQSSRPGGRRNVAPDASSLGLPNFCRSRHYLKGAQVFSVPVWDLPSRWCPEEIRKNASSSSGSASLPSVSSTLAGGDEETEETLLTREGDDDSGSESDQSEIGWEGALGSESRLWSRAAVEGGLVLVRRVQSTLDKKIDSTDDNPHSEATYCLALSSAHFSSEMISAGSDTLLDRRLAEVLKEREPKWAVCALRSGHFAGAVFKGTEAVIHKALHRYTIRAKSGGSQAAQDSTGKKTKSAGSTLRRHGQQRLAEEIQELMTDKWASELAACDIIFVSVSKRMRATLLGTERKPFVSFSKVRRLPFMVGKPTFEAIREAHLRVASVVFSDEATTEILEKPFRPVSKPSPQVAPNSFAPPARVTEEKEDEVPEPKYREEDDELFTSLHRAAAANDEEQIYEILDGGANPTLRDGKGRVPYYLCSNQRGRDAFRRWRGANEDEWDWNQAQVPEGITEDSEQRKKDKEKEKKRRQREKQKAARQQAKDDEEERVKKEEEEKKALEAAQAKCEFCKKPITSKPFTSNNFMYCSTACVSGHRRELQAEAALKRFG